MVDDVARPRGTVEKKTLKKLRDLPIGILEILIMPTQVRFQTFVRSALSIIRLCSAEKFIQ